MNENILPGLIKAGLFLLQLKRENVHDALKARAQAVFDELTKGLPVLPEGMEWEEFLQAKDAELTAKLDALDDRHSG